MLVVAVLSLTGITYAWFTSGTTATVSGMKVEVAVADGGVQVREIKDGNTTPWADTLDLNTKHTTVKPVSSADGVNFFGVTLDTTDSTKYSVAAIDTATKTANVITKTIQFTNPGATDVTIALNSTNSTITAIKNDTTGIEAANHNIHKAARVAIIVGETTYIWTPHTGEYVALVGANATTADYHNVVSGTSETVEITSAGDCEITLPANPTTLESNFVTVTLVIWLEGQDGNCVNVNAGGAFDVALQFEVQTATQG